ncbi:aryl-sulfate sulfotransferase [Campylobacter canadensis]|uniref:Aryl-sulfate sulfotransferase n=1 Tax=Campylobacter canadensis TaxID=449520 RepID=A0ABS7WRJ0_9BACT|nr:aryl-sulfate sulfotransferase [Campylobacter canadensis]MBZ7986952.1 aryl-sulfate sulfotransferase [Campylobacter canadensis]MBZ7994271.1 aryl-sulfate sulfotransferase [Campylobacter canadensis]MBZ7995737.1 aryl-sulfate sulfotransferase [Campylobacter canadensis]MBZ7997988.1 aryl-sulfate sulfotransferase [Campylobacter canadensis]MBZ7999603.1 aryl-sulfate sulfotransferase [Campylobacter canadensis]
MKKFISIVAASMIFSQAAFAIGGASGARIDWQTQGKIGALVLDAYGISPLSAVILNGGYELSDISVSIVPKKDGQELSYKVSEKMAKTYGGIPIFGLYPAYLNTVKVSYTKTANNKSEKVKDELYKISTSGISIKASGNLHQRGVPFESVKVLKVDDEFKNRLYLVNNAPGKMPGISSKSIWNNPAGGAMEWDENSNVFIIDTKGEIRWYLNHDKLMDWDNIYKRGIMMGFHQNDDGALTFGYGQRYAKYDVLGREIFNKRLPAAYIDFSHAMDNMQNGHYLLRVASANTLRADGKNVRTVRDVIVEVDNNGNVVDEWKLYEILDPYRSDIIKALDQGAVCLNVDAANAGKTLSDEELAKMDSSDKFGDIAGTGIGRNWAHVNSVDYDPSDDSIIISSRHQSAIVKIGRDKKIKWILGAHKGWSKEFQKYLLQPVDSKGKKIVCEDGYSKCPGYENEEGGFDFTWTQHTAWRIDSKSNKRYIYVSVFDNGDARGAEQPAFASMKYSRAVIYKIDQKNMKVEQIWEYGKQRGNEWYSPVTSLTEYHADTNSLVVYSATAGMSFDLSKGVAVGEPKPELDEFKWGAKTPSVQIQFSGAGLGYQAMPFDVNKAFNQ